jgi:tetratricopeptide (TPR) repeat protein
MAPRVAFAEARALKARKLLPRLRVAGIVLLAILAALPRPSAAQPVKGTVSAVVENGFARLTFGLGTEIEAQARLANNIVVVTFDRPVDVNVDRLREGAPDYIGAARRDPDGKAVRIALSRRVTMNAMVAGDRLFVDLLPDSWSGLPPGLPREVIEELARRARDAEKKLKQDQQVQRERKVALVRVRVATQPTFTRYVFPLPEPISVAVDNGKDKLTLTFNATLKFDLADAKAALPAVLQSIDGELDQDTAIVRFAFKGKVDVRTFRDDNNYVVDLSSAEAKEVPLGRKPVDEIAALAADVMAKKTPPPGDVEPPQTVPAPSAGAQSAMAPNPMAPSPAEPAVAEPKRAPAAPARQTPATPAAAEGGEGAPMPSGNAVDQPAAPVVNTKPTDSEVARIDPSSAIKVVLKAQGENVALRFPFANPTPAAVFGRGDVLWIVFDTNMDIDLSALTNGQSRNIRSATVMRQQDAAVVRIRLERPRLTSGATEGPAWIVNIGSQMTDKVRPLGLTRNGAAPAQANVTVAIAEPHALHRIEDPEAGDALLVVTALAPARGFINGQEFVEFRVLPSAHGIVVQPLADDLNLALFADRVSLTRPNGLTLSGFAQPAPTQADDRPSLTNTQLWDFDRKDDFGTRESQLMFAAARANEAQRLAARVDLARFYLAWERSAEAKGVLDVAIKDSPPRAGEPLPLVLRAVADLLLERPQDALKDLASPIVGNQYEAPLWRAWANAQLSHWGEANDGFRDAPSRLPRLPVELQRRAMQEIMRAAIEVGDVTGALNMMHEFEVLGIPRELEPIMAVYNGELAEWLGRNRDALQSYRVAADSSDRRAAAQGELHEIMLRTALGRMPRGDAIDSLETLTTIWRGDDTELAALKLLAHLYTRDGRYRDSFHVMRTALSTHPNADGTRGIQDEAADTFENLFLAGRGDMLPAIDALALFYDFRDLTPIGRRGDEMIRRLADRLVAVDLLEQAAELLQYQVDHRLQGAARAQVAMRLAMIYLMDHRPENAFATLRATRVEDVNNELRQQRLLIEARALSDMGRHDVALEIIANIQGPEANKLRADILWAGHRWREAAEQIETAYGDRWQQFTPLNDVERADILRAAAGYALGDDALGLGRFRERYAGKMGEGADHRAFDVITEPLDASGTDFRTVAHSVAAVDTLSGFLRDMQTRFPQTSLPTAAPRTAPGATGSAPLNRTASR